MNRSKKLVFMALENTRISFPVQNESDNFQNIIENKDDPESLTDLNNIPIVFEDGTILLESANLVSSTEFAPLDQSNSPHAIDIFTFSSDTNNNNCTSENLLDNSKKIDPKSTNNSKSEADCMPLKNVTNTEIKNLRDVAEESEEFLGEGYLDDNDSDFSVTQANRETIDDAEVDDVDVSKERNKRAKRRSVDMDNWKRNKNRIKRMKGETYIGFTRNNGEWKNDTVREERKIKNRCEGKHGRNKIYQCDQITEEERNEVFNKFWKDLSWDQKKIFVVNNVQKTEPKRRKTENIDTQKSETYFYYLQIRNKRHRVCKTMFLNSLSLGEWSVRHWCKDGNHGMVESLVEKVNKRNEKRVPKIGERRKFLENWLDKLPKMPAHYCRAESKKLYIEDNLLTNKSQLYKMYVECCEQKPLSSCVFDEVIEQKNIGIFQPRKDQCDVCCSFKSGNLNNEEYEAHISDKNRARLEKQKDKEDSLKGKCHVLAMDLQAVQLCPRMYASTLYYKQKLRVHNFTVYNLATHQSTNYWWHEGEGRLEASTFVSCILDYLQTNFAGSDIPIILYSDGCGYQNRNCILANALLAFSVRNNVVVEQKYLVKGHTQMECDSVHSLIERRLKKREIYLPGEYITVTRQARQKPFPLGAKYLQYDFFKNYADSAVQWYSSIKPTSANKVVDIRSLKYTPTGTIYFKIDLDSEYMAIRKNKTVPVEVMYRNLYSSKPKISYEKYKQLLEITKVMNPDYHAFYKNLPHDNKKK